MTQDKELADVPTVEMMPSPRHRRDDHDGEESDKFRLLPSPYISNAGAETTLHNLVSERHEQKENGLLKLPVFPSSGRIPRTPPPSPEIFLIHSPEKDQSRVAPMSPQVKQHLVSAELETNQMESAQKSEDFLVWTDPEKTGADNLIKESEVLEQKTAMLGNTFDNLTVNNGSKVFVHRAKTLEEPLARVVQTPVPDYDVAVTAENAFASSTVIMEPFNLEEPHVVKPTGVNDFDNPLTVDSTEEEIMEVIEQIISELPTDTSPGLLKPSQPQLCTKRKKDVEFSATMISSLVVENKASLASVNGENVDRSKKTESKDISSKPQLQLRSSKRSRNVDIKPPPASDGVIPSTLQPERYRTHLNLSKKEKSDLKAKPKSLALKSTVSKTPAVKSRQVLRRYTEPKKALALSNSGETKLFEKSLVPVSSSLVEQNESMSAPPTPAVGDVGSQRNVKRRPNTSNSDKESSELYENDEGAKIQKGGWRTKKTCNLAVGANNTKRDSSSNQVGRIKRDLASRLHARAKEMQDKKLVLQQQYKNNGCTSTPTISGIGKRLLQSKAGPRFENLYQHAQEMKQRREEQLEEKTKITEQQCPFKPQITAAKLPLKSTMPLYDSEREKQKWIALEMKKIEVELSRCTFKPKITAKRRKSESESLSDSKSTEKADTNPFDRLYQASIDRSERLLKLRQEREEEEKAQTPFQPKITARSQKLKSKTNTKKPFYERLYDKDYLKKLETEREQRRLNAERQFTFKPEINERPDGFKTKVNGQPCPQKSIFERLYKDKEKLKEKIEQGEELRLQNEMAECTFRPKIEVNGSPSSERQALPVWERLLSYEKAQVIENREKLKEMLEMQECTFKPDVKSLDTQVAKESPLVNVLERPTTSGNTSPLDPSRARFITERPIKSSRERQNSEILNAT